MSRTRRWRVTLRITMGGAQAEVDAASETEAMQKARDGLFVDAIETNCAELVDHWVTKIVRDGWSE